MTIISFVLFILIYLLVTLTAIEPYYIQGLVFGIPFISFGVITIMIINYKIKNSIAKIITIILIPIFGFAMLFCFFWLIFDAAITTTTDISKYERILKFI